MNNKGKKIIGVICQYIDKGLTTTSYKYKNNKMNKGLWLSIKENLIS